MFDLLEKEEFNFDYVSMFASSKCTDCYGRGYQVLQLGTKRGSIAVQKNEPTKTFYKECACVRASKKKNKV